MRYKQIVFIILFYVSCVFSGMFQITSQSDFDEGSYLDTHYNSSYVQLDSGDFSGYYVSKLFTSGSVTLWENITWTPGGYYGLPLPDNGFTEPGLCGANMSGNILLLHLDELTGEFQDTSGYHNSGSPNGNPQRGVSGRFNNSVYLDGVDDYIQVNNDLPSSSVYTVSLWIRVDGDHWNGALVGFGTSSGTTYDLYYFNNGSGCGCSNDCDYFGFNTWNCDSYGIAHASRLLNDGEWHHVVAEFHNSDVHSNRIWIDGVEYSLSQVKGSTPDRALNRHMCVGCNGWYTSSQMWKGNIDEVVVWDRTLSEDEIRCLYERGILRFNVSVRVCNITPCSTGWDYLGNSPPLKINKTSRYLQFNFTFFTENINYTPELYNVTIYYQQQNSPPNITLEQPQNNTTVYNPVRFRYSVVDNNSTENISCEVYLDGNLVRSVNLTNGSSDEFDMNLGIGIHNWYVMCEDSEGATSISHTYQFSVNQQTSSSGGGGVSASSVARRVEERLSDEFDSLFDRLSNLSEGQNNLSEQLRQINMTLLERDDLLLNRLDNLTQHVDQMGRNMRSQYSNIIMSLDSQRSILESVDERLIQTDTKIDTLAGKLDSQNERINRLEKGIDQLTNRLFNMERILILTLILSTVNFLLLIWLLRNHR